MKIDNLSEMIKGWFVGDFDKSALRTKDFEVAIKKYKAGESESRHVHKVAIEITVIVSGRVIMNNNEYKENDIITIPPNESTDFHVLEDTITVVVKTPSVIGDKYIL